MIKKFVFCLVAMLLIPSVLCAGEKPFVEFEGRYWYADLDADAKVVDSNIGNDIDLKNDLGIKDEDFPEGRVSWFINDKHSLRFSYVNIGYSGSKNVTKSIEFNGKTYSIGSLVETDLDLTYLRIAWMRELFSLFNDKVKVNTVFEGKGLIADVSLYAPNVSPVIDEEEEFAGGIPTGGLSINIDPIDRVKMFCEISGLSAGSYGYFFDAEAGVKIMPLDNFSIVGGYRIIDIKAESDPDYVKIEISGPFIGGTINF